MAGILTQKNVLIIPYYNNKLHNENHVDGITLESESQDGIHQKTEMAQEKTHLDNSGVVMVCDIQYVNCPRRIVIHFAWTLVR